MQIQFFSFLLLNQAKQEVTDGHSYLKQMQVQGRYTPGVTSYHLWSSERAKYIPPRPPHFPPRYCEPARAFPSCPCFECIHLIIVHSFPSRRTLAGKNILLSAPSVVHSNRTAFLPSLPQFCLLHCGAGACAGGCLLHGSQEPARYNRKDPGQVIGFKDMPNELLSQSRPYLQTFSLLP